MAHSAGVHLVTSPRQRLRVFLLIAFVFLCKLLIESDSFEVVAPRSRRVVFCALQKCLPEPENQSECVAKLNWTPPSSKSSQFRYLGGRGYCPGSFKAAKMCKTHLTHESLKLLRWGWGTNSPIRLHVRYSIIMSHKINFFWKRTVFWFLYKTKPDFLWLIAMSNFLELCNSFHQQ